MDDFTAQSLPLAIKKLFELNNYTVDGPVKRHGAEIDLIARPLGSPFPRDCYIEATVEYVDHVKYGKDITKLAMIREVDPDADRIIVSSRGFTVDVKERAAASRIQVLTYSELFSRFERFDRYVKYILDDSDVARELRNLSEVYEEPCFDDIHGMDLATGWMGGWLEDSSAPRWLILVGEYGTGKTALTKVLQRRWVQRYKESPDLPIPFRIELRDFTRQFDAAGLIHHFLDHNDLKHISLDFAFSLIRAGRVVLLLDGYDEMAQYLTSRERRACLRALADLSADGARGVLTSRPNYFSEAEELHILDVLYTSLEHSRTFVPSSVQRRIQEEKQLDELLRVHFLERYERALRDLTPEQTEQLVARALAGDSQGRDVVIWNIATRISKDRRGLQYLALWQASDHRISTWSCGPAKNLRRCSSSPVPY